MFEKKIITGLRRSLLAWFKRTARDLPWRRTRDPYAIWISEIMLQQTRVETVIPYYLRFLDRFPNIAALAQAKQDDLLKLWEGMGYYRRALHLHKAAKIIANEYDGVFPQTLEEWKRLPGVGDYTAGAVASIAFGVRAPALDGNAKRVLARLGGEQGCIDESATAQRLRALAKSLLPAKEPGAFNQAIMELGAQLCTPKQPLCCECPIRKYCAAASQGFQKNIPVRKSKKPVPHRVVVAAAILKNGRYLLGKRPPGGMLEGLWEFPGGKVEGDETQEAALRREIQEELGICVRVGRLIASVDHVYSHLAVTIHLYLCEPMEEKPHAIYHSEIKWIPRSQLRRYAFPAANVKFLDYL
ncbi:MAG: A/G-specific adenine glycosylase [Candidatus Omnitrophota bacterium]